MLANVIDACPHAKSQRQTKFIATLLELFNAINQANKRIFQLSAFIVSRESANYTVDVVQKSPF